MLATMSKKKDHQRPGLTVEDVQAMDWEQRDRLAPEDVPEEIRTNPELRHELFRSPTGLYGVDGAARYIGVSYRSGVNYYDYRLVEQLSDSPLRPVLIGRSRVYTQESLDEFERTRRPAGFLPGWRDKSD